MLKKIILLLITAIALQSCFSSDKVEESTNLESIMKQMGKESKLLANSTTPESMQTHVANFKLYVEESRKSLEAQRDTEVFNAGLDKLDAVLIEIETDLKNNNLELAKNKLTQLDNIKKDYHKQLGLKK